jgi:uncharacterized protein YggU (UPF0235/DUF167 family)
VSTRFLQVRATPRADRDAVEVTPDGIVSVKVRAAPTRGAANEAVARALAEALGLRKSCVRIRSGLSSRTKTVELDGLDAQEATRMLGARRHNP